MAELNRVARRIKFRLDDGSLIADSALLGLETAGVVSVKVNKEIVDRQLASEKELERLQRLLSDPNLPSVPNGFDGPPSKRARLDSRPSLSLGGGLDWVAKCRQLIQNVIHGLKNDAHWFMSRVDENLAPDYYTIVKQPVWIGLILQKLERNEYPTAQDFADEVRLMWSNCYLYNPVGNSVRAVAEKADKRWENDWGNSGLAAERTKRATAGVAAAKFDPDYDAPPPKSNPTYRSGAAPTKSGGGNASGKKQTPAAPASGPGRAQNGGRAYSHEVTSGGQGRTKALSLDRRNQIASELQTALGELSEDQLGELMSLLPQEAMQPDESGEVELDFEALDDANLRKLDNWLRNVRGQAPQVSPSHISHNPSVRLEAGDVEDEEYHSD